MAKTLLRTAAIACAALVVLGVAWTCARGRDRTQPERPVREETSAPESQVAQVPEEDPVPPSRAARPAAPAERAAKPPAGPLGVITGRVLVPEDAPAPGAAVRLVPDADEERAQVVRCDADGRFRAEKLPAARWTLVVAGAGFATRLDIPGTEPTVVELADGEERAVEMRATPLAVVHGTVRGSDGRPVAGAKVEVTTGAFLYRNHSAWTLEAVTGDDGRYEVRNVTPGTSVQVHVTAEGSPRWSRFVPDAEVGARLQVDADLPASLRFHVRVVDADTELPVKGMLVWFYDAQGRLLAENGSDSVRSDADGRAAITVPAGQPISLQVNGPGYVTVQKVSVPDSAAQVGPLIVRMTPVLVIAGRVLYADGGPAAGLHVSAQRAGLSQREAMEEFRGWETTDAEGRFRMEKCSAGRWVVFVTAGSMEMFAPREVAAGTQDVELRLPEGVRIARRVTVRITAPGGAKTVAVRTRQGVYHPGEHGGLQTLSGGVPGEPETTVELDPNGVTFVEAWDARDAAGVRLPLGHVRAHVPREAADTWTFAMPAERFVAGRVVGPDGAGIARASVVAVAVPPWPLDADEEAHDEGDYVEIARVATGEDGAFRAGGLGDHDYELRITADGFEPAKAPVHGGKDPADVILRRK